MRSFELKQDTTILVVDDDTISLGSISKLLSDKGHRVLVAPNGEVALQIIQQNKPDLILLDIYMPGMSGIEVCQTITLNEELSGIPILFLTSSEEDIEQAFKAGGVDYIVKPFKITELMARVNTHLKISGLMSSLEETTDSLKDLNAHLEEIVKARTIDLVTANANLRKEINERRHLQDRLDYLSRFDFVTRMYNRNSMEELIEKRIFTQDPAGNKLNFFLYMDIDQFKIVNDTCGHIAGDELLKELAELIKGLIKEDDDIARMGGDEFSLLFGSESQDNALLKANLLKEKIEDFHFNWEEEVFQVGVSMGLVEVNHQFDSVNHIISIAERTCFESKSKGGGEVSFYNLRKHYVEESKEQMRWIPIIQKALENDEFYLCGQHITEIATMSVKKMEVLIRLKMPNRASVPPGHFIPVAERYHKITAIDKWVLNNALSHKHLFERDFQVSVNISGETIIKQDSAEQVIEALARSGISGHQLCFEITETSAMSNIKETEKFIIQLKEYGCQFSLDDFGTGTSSYQYLKDLPIDFLKIDGIFVRDLEHEKINQMMVESITSIAQEMNIKVIAECVETEAALNILKDFGVDYAQGFLLHRPTPLIDLIK